MALALIQFWGDEIKSPSNPIGNWGSSYLYTIDFQNSDWLAKSETGLKPKKPQDPSLQQAASYAKLNQTQAPTGYTPILGRLNQVSKEGQIGVKAKHRLAMRAR